MRPLASNSSFVEILARPKPLLLTAGSKTELGIVLRNKSSIPLSLTPAIELEVGGRTCAVTVLSEVRVGPRSELTVRAPLSIPRVAGRGWLVLLVDGDASCEARVAVYVAEENASRPRLRALLLEGRRALMGKSRLRVMPVKPGLKGVIWRAVARLVHGPLLLVAGGVEAVERLRAGERALVLIDEGDGVYRLESGRLRRVLPPPPPQASLEEWARRLIITLLEHDAGKGRDYVLVWRGPPEHVRSVEALAGELWARS
ncbi:MAG: hypothetical protein DRJ96_00295 [Thermoprotei archaeon]|nr:MAG: hypothetical protein DRJ96_00295 [Thermoprotei archaeon]